MDTNNSSSIIGNQDRILSLPRDTIDRILGFMSTRDAVRTSILSREWRFLWAEHPVLVINNRFSEDIMRNRSSIEFQEHFVHSIDKLLLQHEGPILKFALEVPKPFSIEYHDLNLWMRFLSRQGLEDLTLNNSKSASSYRVPSCIFSCHTLKMLNLSKCILKYPIANKTPSFLMLTKLRLKHVTFEPSSAFTIPTLLSLDIRQSEGIHYLIVLAPKLSSLSLVDNDRLDLSSHMNCPDLSYLCVGVMANGVICNRQNERITSKELLSCWPKLSVLILDASFLEYIVPDDNVPHQLPSGLNHLTIFRIRYDFEQISRVVSLIRVFPNLSTLEAWGDGTIQDDKKAVKYLEEQNLFEERIHGFRTVKLMRFQGSRAELLIVKLLLSRSPSLERMFIEEKQDLDTQRRLETSRQLMRFSRASTKAEIVLQQL